MYLEHFGLNAPPCSLTPDTGFFYDRGTHREALNVLLTALGSGEGFVKITGEVGTGKTLLCRKLLTALGPERVCAYIPDPLLSGPALRRALTRELGLDDNLTSERRNRALHQRLLDVAERWGPVVLLLDEAQALPDEALEAVRLLSNLETERHKLLQVVLFGQPELDRRLARTELRQLRQRIGFSYTLAPLGSQEVGAYLDHRLRVAGHRGRPLLSAAALRRIHRASNGIPRLVNILTHKALMAAYGEGSPGVEARHVRRAVLDTEAAHSPRSLGYALGLALSAAAGLGFYLVRLGGLP